MYLEREILRMPTSSFVYHFYPADFKNIYKAIYKKKRKEKQSIYPWTQPPSIKELYIWKL